MGEPLSKRFTLDVAVLGLRIAVAVILLASYQGGSADTPQTLLVLTISYIAISTTLAISKKWLNKYPQLKFLALISDFFFIIKMCTIIGPVESYLVYAYFTLILLASLQLGIRGSLAMALLVTAFDYYYTRGASGELYLYGSIFMRVGFTWVGAFALGTAFQNIFTNKSKITQLNEDLDSKITVLVSASRVLGSINDLDKLIPYFQETTSRIFGISRYVLAIKADERNEALIISSAGVDESNLTENFFQLEEEMLMTDVKVSDLGLSIGATHKGTQGFYILLVGGDGLQRILTDKDIFQTIFSQFIMVIDNALLLQKAEEASLTDHLTNLYNQRYFYVRITEELNRAKRNKDDLSLLMIDVDYFKNYNDTYGHLSGDKALAKIANLIKAAGRDSDIAARYGGEEFVVILPDADGGAATEVAERIINSVKNERYPGHSDELNVKLTVSIGISSYPNHGAEVTDIIERADKALYKAKALGKDRCAVARKRRAPKKRGPGTKTRSA
ncbi:MAG: GGDEF domain-containing protein [Candidatus Aquicultor sp.]|nr:GGDEF domain-containing protein [Candidatus Aquicultor sp.]